MDFVKEKALKKSTLPRKKSTFLANKAPISQTKSTSGAEKKHLVNIILLTKSNKKVLTIKLQISEWCCIVMNVVTLCSGEQVMKGVQKLMM